MSKHNKSHAQSIARNNDRNNDRNRGRNNARNDSRHDNRPAQERRFDMRRGTKMPPVVSKSDVQLGAPSYSSKFVPSKNGGLMAEIRVHGRIVFPDSRGPQPKNDGKAYAFEIVGENPKQTVYFARVAVPEEAASSTVKIVIDPSGKMRALGRRPAIVSNFRSTKQSEIRLAEFRSARPGMWFDHSGDDDDFGLSGYGFGYEDDIDGLDFIDPTDVEEHIAEEISAIQMSLKPRRENLAYCDEDGTSWDWPLPQGVRPVLKQKGGLPQLF